MPPRGLAMLQPRRRLPLLLILLAGASVVVPATAQQRERGRHAPPTAESREDGEDRAPMRMPQSSPRAERPFQEPRRDRNRGQDALSDSIRRIERNTRGQVLSAERVPYDGRSVNRIKVVDDQGRVRIYMDDPQDGAPPAVPTRGDDD